MLFRSPWAQAENQQPPRESDDQQTLRRTGIRFIGTLYNMHPRVPVVPKTVIDENILRIIPSLTDGRAVDREDAIECLIILLSTCGFLLEVRDRQQMDAYFAQLSTLYSQDRRSKGGRMLAVSDMALKIHIRH